MLERLLIVLQTLCSIPPIYFVYSWSTRHPHDYFWEPLSWMFILFLISLIPFGILIVVKWIIYGKLYIFKIGEGPRSWEEEIGGRWKKGRGRWNKEKGEEK